jgi:hypothetical protein
MNRVVRESGRWFGLVGSVLLTFSVVFWAPGSRTSAKPAEPAPVFEPQPQDGNFGSIKGRLIWGGAAAPGPLAPKVSVGKATTDPGVCAATAPIPDESLVVDPKTMGVKHVIVYIFRPNGSNPDKEKALLAKTPKVTVDQKNCTFIPHVLAMHQEQKVLFTSADPVNHNVHVNGFQNASNDIVPGKGSIEKALKAENPVVNVKCDIHGWMQSYIKVLDHPFFAVTNDDGTFEITGIPPGDQTIVLWHESGFVFKEPGGRRVFKIEAGKTTDLGDVKLDPAKFMAK